MNTDEPIYLTTTYGNRLTYRGPSPMSGMLEVETDDGYKTTVLIADLRPSEALADVLANPRHEPCPQDTASPEGTSQ